MIVYNEKTTVRFLKEITNLHKITENPDEQNLRGRKAKLAKKLYNGDTSKFDPIQENRDHLIYTLAPLIIKLAKEKCGKTTTFRIEYDDLLQAGLEGAIVATDIYIERSKDEIQPAKLSTYAYTWIQKYINEYIYANTTTLSHGVTQGRAANACTVLAGNKTNENADNGSGEYFETSNEVALMTTIELKPDESTIDNLSSQMFSVISKEQKTALFMFFGIGHEQKYDLKDIAKSLRTTMYKIEVLINDALTAIKSAFSGFGDKKELMEIFLSTDLSQSVHWQR